MVGTALLVALAYVGIIYGGSRLVAPKVWLNRDNVRVIKGRMVAVGLYSSLLLYIFPPSWHFTIWPILKTLVLLMPLIYVKALSSLLLLKDEKSLVLSKFRIYGLLCKETLIIHLVALVSGNVQYWRDYIIGPIAEEIVFRHTLLSYLIPNQNMLAASLFGLVHAHSLLIDTTPWSATLLQCAFTTIFGWYVGRIFMATRSISTCVVVHSVCNLVGFLDFDDLFQFNHVQKLWIFILFIISIAIFIQI